MKYYICPSVLSADLAALGEAVDGLVEGGAEWIHVDIMDGHFVSNMTFGPMAVQAVRKHAPENVIVDAHLMIENPDRWAVEYRNAGADIVIVHAEATPHIHGVIQQIRNAGAKPGVSINPGTPLSSIEEILSDLDLVLIMSVNPGFGGQKFIPESLDKVRRLKKMIDDRGLEVEIQVDGGVNVDNVAEVARAGANAFVMGNGVFGDPEAKKGNFKPIIKAAYGALKDL